MKRYAFTKAAADDLRAIHDYTLTNISMDRADDLVDSIEAAAAKLARMPGIGAPRPKLGKDVRMHVFGRYRIFYRTEGDTVWIQRLLHGARELPFEILDEPE